CSSSTGDGWLKQGRKSSLLPLTDRPPDALPPQDPPMTFRTRIVSATLLLLVCRATAAPPQISRVSVPGLQSGTATMLIIDGADLTPNPRIILPVPIVSQT